MARGWVGTHPSLSSVNLCVEQALQNVRLHLRQVCLR